MRISDWISDVCSSDLFTFSRVISKTYDPLEDFPSMPFRSILRAPVVVGLLAAGPLHFASPLIVSAIASERHVHAQDAAMQMRRRTEERRDGKGRVSTGRPRCWPYH